MEQRSIATFILAVFMAPDHGHCPSPSPAGGMPHSRRPSATSMASPSATSMASRSAIPSPAPSPSSTPSPTLSVAFPATGPILTQETGNRWSTSIVMDSFPTCLKGLLYELVIVSPNSVINGQIDRITQLEPGPNTKRAIRRVLGLLREAHDEDRESKFLIHSIPLD